MQRVLDIDLDFFVTPVVFWPQSDDRPGADDHEVWPIDEALSFLGDRCGLTGPLPGFVTENHGELFPLWREAVSSGLLDPPFHVTHVDAHADIGMGDAGYRYLMEDLLYLPPHERRRPRIGGMSGLTDGNYLLFAIACRWVGDLIYVYGEGGSNDELYFAMQGFDMSADHVQLAAMDTSEVDKLLHRLGAPAVSHLEPAVPYRSTRWESFQAEGPYDFVCLTRSPPYTPDTADNLYDAIRAAFIQPIALDRADGTPSASTD
jgi:hypothetical protein